MTNKEGCTDPRKRIISRKWQYQVVTIKDNDSAKNMLDTFGSEGWELVAVLHKTGHIRFFFKKVRSR